jgi:2-phospho-L-lactate/phosphoenolpyruvate guanylyltransferase
VPTTVVLLPVKPPDLAKTRLAALGDGVRRELAVAFARDTLEAVAAAGVDRIVVVTDDAGVGELARASAVGVEPDTHGLNDSLRAAAARQPDGSRVVAVCADLPALRPTDLSAALADLPEGPAFVADRAGTGTTVYAAARHGFAPAFGPGSAERHRAAGVLEIGRDLPSLRLDVDDVEALRLAEAFGVGRHTQQVLAAIPH